MSEIGADLSLARLVSIGEGPVLITGAGGFIGRALAARLTQDGIRVRGLVHTPHGATSLAGIETVAGDVSDEESVQRATAGCQIVVHCAALQGKGASLAEFRRVNVAGTLNVLRAAKAAGVRRFVHVSTINVHGQPPPPDANAESPLCFDGDYYSVSKAEGEQAAFKFARELELPLTVVRPGCTYGPESEAWTLVPLRRVERGVPVLFGDGSGMCNAIYIDNLIDLLLLVLTHDVAGEAFIGTEGRGVPWREFYGAYARMAGVAHLRAMPRPLALAIAAASEMASRWTGRSAWMSRSSVEFYSHRVVFEIAKSRKRLGFTPRVDFAEGMRRTERWLIEKRNLERAALARRV